MRTRIKISIASLALSCLFIAEQGMAVEPARRIPPPPPPRFDNLDQQLQNLIVQRNLTVPNLAALNIPSISDPIAQLGKKLFFTKNLGGNQTAACASCHHPLLAGADTLSLPVGVNAIDETNQAAHDLLGSGRFSNTADNTPLVPRNSPTIFNIALYVRGLFWDSRVERDRNGAILTPDSMIVQQGRRRADSNFTPNDSLATAQAGFPVTSVEEMRAEFIPGIDNKALREALNSRFNNSMAQFINQWPAQFSTVFNDETITFKHIARAVGEYERSMVFINNPWFNYLKGDLQALNNDQKAGALLFFTPPQNGGAGCAACHNGPSFSDERHHLVAFPQIGVGKDNASNTATNTDFGRENVTNNNADRYHFRTPSLLNIAHTAPYGHSGAYQTLEQVVRHYSNPRGAINQLFGSNVAADINENSAYCQLEQIQGLMLKNSQSCASIFNDAHQNSILVASHLEQAQRNEVPVRAVLAPQRGLNPTQSAQLVAFLHALSDPCLTDKNCLAPWLLSPEEQDNFPDQFLLKAVDQDGNTL